MKLITTTIVLLGTVAGAMTAVKQLWPAPDPGDSARLTAIRINSEVPLSEYLRRLAAMGPHSFAAGVPRRPRAASASAGASSTPQPATSTRGSTAVSSVGPTSTAPTPSRSGTTAADPTSSADPTTSSGGSPSIREGFVLPPGVDRGFPEAVTAEFSKLDPGICPPSADADTCWRWVARSAVGVATDDKGNPVSPEVAAERVLQVLTDARQTRVASPADSRSPETEPVGALVTVDVELSGLRGRDVLLSWSMWQSAGAIRLHGDWLNSNLAYRLQPTAELDTTTVDLWVPLPATAGPYFIRVDLSSQGSRLTSVDSEPFQ